VSGAIGRENTDAQALLGDEHTAKAQEQSHTRSSGFYEIMVSNQHGKVIAHFRSRSFTRGEPLINQQGL